MMQRHEEFDVLDELRKHGPLPRQLEERHQRLRRQQFYKAGLECDRYPPSSTSRLVPADMSVADWVRAKWTSADATVRRSLRAIAEALGIPLPLARTRHVAVQDSSPTRRSEFTRHPNHGEPAPTEGPAGRKQRDYHDPPAWDDDDAEGWEPVESLRDAFRSDDDRGWY